MAKLFLNGIIMSILISACSDNTDAKPFIRKPMDIVIQKNAAWDGFIKTDETEENCRDFVLTEQDVNEFFRVAREESEQQYSQGQAMSRCYVEGTLSLPRKYKGKWRIDQARRGILLVESDRAYFFYCDLCGSRKFAEPK